MIAGLCFVGACLAAVASDESALGEAVCRFAREHVGQQVGDGECSSLAIAALRAAGARTTHDFGVGGDGQDYAWGEEVRKPTEVRPGDIIQFRDARFRRTALVRRGNMLVRQIETVACDHHTAVVVKVLKPRRYLIAEQNVIWPGEDEEKQRLVRLRPLDLGERVRGTIRFYRPVKREEMMEAEEVDGDIEGESPAPSADPAEEEIKTP